MKNRAQLATFASVPFVLLALLACKGFSKSTPKPAASVTAAVTAEPTPTETAAQTADTATATTAAPKATHAPTAAVAASAKPAPSASVAAATKDAGVAAAKDAGVATAKDAGASIAATTFKVGDKVQVHWKSSWYPASVIAVPSPGQYKIHYDGYEASWDETVGNDRIKAR